MIQVINQNLILIKIWFYNLKCLWYKSKIHLQSIFNFNTEITTFCWLDKKVIRYKHKYILFDIYIIMSSLTYQIILYKNFDMIPRFFDQKYCI